MLVEYIDTIGYTLCVLGIIVLERAIASKARKVRI